MAQGNTSFPLFLLTFRIIIHLNDVNNDNDVTDRATSHQIDTFHYFRLLSQSTFCAVFTIHHKRNSVGIYSQVKRFQTSQPAFPCRQILR